MKDKSESPMTSVAPVAIDEPSLREPLMQQFGRETVEAEQRLSATQPLHLDNYIQRCLRAFSSAFGQHGNLEQKFQSSNGEVFADFASGASRYINGAGWTTLFKGSVSLTGIGS